MLPRTGGGPGPPGTGDPRTAQEERTRAPRPRTPAGPEDPPTPRRHAVRPRPPPLVAHGLLTTADTAERASDQRSRRCDGHVRFDSPGRCGFSRQLAVHSAGHGAVDHRPGSPRQGCVVPCRTAVPHQPAKGPLEHSPLRKRLESPRPRSLHDFHIDARSDAMVGEGSLDQSPAGIGDITAVWATNVHTSSDDRPPRQPRNHPKPTT